MTERALATSPARLPPTPSATRKTCTRCELARDDRLRDVGLVDSQTAGELRDDEAVLVRGPYAAGLLSPKLVTFSAAGGSRIWMVALEPAAAVLGLVLHGVTLIRGPVEAPARISSRR